MLSHVLRPLCTHPDSICRCGDPQAHHRRRKEKHARTGVTLPAGKLTADARGPSAGYMCLSPVPGARPTAQGNAPRAGTRSVPLPAARASLLAPEGPAANRAELFAAALGASGEAPGRPRPSGGARGPGGRATAGSREGRASQRLTFFVCSRLDGGRR